MLKRRFYFQEQADKGGFAVRRRYKFSALTKQPASFLFTIFFGMALTACDELLSNSPDSKTVSEWKWDTRKIAEQAIHTAQTEKTRHAAPGADFSACDTAVHKANQALTESESAVTREIAKSANDKAKEALRQAKNCAKSAGEEAIAKRIAHRAERIAEQARGLADEVKNEADTKRKHYEDLKRQGQNVANNIKTIDRVLKIAKEVETEAGKIKVSAENVEKESEASALLKRAKAARQKIEDAGISLFRF